MTNKMNHVLGGGTFSHVRAHLALGVPAFGETAIAINEILQRRGEPSTLHLTKMADPRNSKIVTNEDLQATVDNIVADPATNIVFFNAAVADEGQVGDVPSSKYAERLQSRNLDGANVKLTAAPKIVTNIRKHRKDIFLVAFKATAGDTQDVQYAKALRTVKESHVNLVLANDTVTRTNMIVVPEEARYHITTNRKEALENLVDMALLRSGLHFTRSTVIDGPRVPWNGAEVSGNLRFVVDHCINRGAYKPFLGKTAGHFASRGPQAGTFLTSARSSNFNLLSQQGLVFVENHGLDEVVARGAKPSVGGQSQRIVFADHPELDHIVHFHCPIKLGSKVSVREQRPYECGSHECGKNTSSGLKEMADGIFAVYLENHGPNVVFANDVDPDKVVRIIEDNFDLDQKTGGVFQYDLAP